MRQQDRNQQKTYARQPIQPFADVVSQCSASAAERSLLVGAELFRFAAWRAVETVPATRQQQHRRW